MDSPRPTQRRKLSSHVEKVGRCSSWVGGAAIRPHAPSKGRTMKLLLTSAGVKNESIHKALVELLGKPITQCDALCIPTAGYGHPRGSPGGAWRFVSGQEPRCPMV